MKVLLVAVNSSYVHTNLALRYLRERCKAGGITAHLAEYTINNQVQLIIRDLCSYNPDVIALSVYVWNYSEVTEICQDIKKYLPQVKIVLGGPEVSYNAREVMLSNCSVDYILCGECGDEFVDLLNKIKAFERMSTIPALVWRDSDDIRCNLKNRHEYFTDLFPYNESDFNNLNKIFYYESSRGCPYKCSYCLSAAEQDVRYRDSTQVIHELKYLIARKPNLIKFVDRTFNCNAAHSLGILGFLSSVVTDCKFHFEITAELVSDEFIRLLQAAPPGRFQLEIGLQTFCATALKAINRYNNLQLIKTNIEKIRTTGKVHIHVDLIAGLPHESYQEFAESFDIAWGLDADVLQLGFLKILHGTPLAYELSEHDYLYTDSAPYEVISNKYITAAQIMQLKGIEEILELFVNSGRARSSIQFLSEKLNSAFSVLEAIAGYWCERRLYMQPHSPARQIRLLYDAVAALWPEYLSEFSDILKKEIYLKQRSLLHSQDMWFDYELTRKQSDAFFRDEVLREKYCQGFKMSSWRHLRNCFETGVFCSGGKANVLLFDYRYTPAKEYVVDSDDFFNNDTQR